MRCKACLAPRGLGEATFFRDGMPVCPDCHEPLAVELDDDTPLDSPTRRVPGYPWFIGPVATDVGHVQ